MPDRRRQRSRDQDEFELQKGRQCEERRDPRDSRHLPRGQKSRETVVVRTQQVRLSGQHEEMIVLRHGGEVERVDTIDLGFPIGLDDEIADFIDYITIDLAPGDGVVLYTDGITEAENGRGDHYGLKRLCEVVCQHWSRSAESIKDVVIQDVQRHIGGHVVYDDITLVVAKQR